jgi:Cu2+-exporting ATPase
MTCCAPGVEAATEMVGQPETSDETLLAASADLGDGLRQLDLSVPDIHCTACISTIEKGLMGLPMVENARVNFSTKRVRIAYWPAKGRPSLLTETIRKSGYRSFLLDPEADAKTDKTLVSLIRALAVSGFAAANIMLFSVSIWSGAEPVTRDLFHWISALIAVPAVAYAGRPFFNSAWRAVRHGVLNMDVPISLAVLLALALSIFETFNHGAHAYFDAAVSLLFFLLVGRTLDHMMREKARSAVRNLARLAPPNAMVRNEDGSRERVSVNAIVPGMLLEIAAGERLPVDADIVTGDSAVDLSLVSGESVPQDVGPESALLAGTTNISAPLLVRASRPAADSFLARMIGLMEAAEGSKAGYKRIADRAAEIYAPAVHLLALATLLGWGILSGDWHNAVLNAIAVLIITCPCALALAVPIVHVVASGRLFEQGIMMRDGAALERLAEIDRVAFDKTGTLTVGKPAYAGQFFGAEKFLSRAASLAAVSRHPFSQALTADVWSKPVSGDVSEVAGAGVEARLDDGVWRLGSAKFCNAEAIDGEEHASAVWLSHDGVACAGFSFEDPARAEARSSINALKTEGLQISLLSGDRAGPVAALAKSVGIDDARPGLTPADKVDALHSFAEAGEKVLMVGDGLNDAPALRAAHTSMAPSSASDIGRNAADFIYTSDTLDAVPFTLGIAKRAARMVYENFGLAIVYNCIAVPLAVTGHVTPLVAAIAMSSSSILVTLNALRLRLGGARSPRVIKQTSADMSDIAVAR